MSLEMFWLHLALPFHTACLFLCWHELELNIMPMFDELTVQCAVHGKYLLAGVLLFFKLTVCAQSVTTTIQANRYQIEISMAYA